MKIIKDDSYERVWQSEKLNNGDFDYYFHIEMKDLEQYTGDKGYSVIIYASKDTAYLEERQIKNIADTYCISSEEITPYEICEYGFSANLGAEGANTKREALKLVKAFIKQLPLYEMLFGFYMDRHQNSIGNTGWDFISGQIGFQTIKN